MSFDPIARFYGYLTLEGRQRLARGVKFFLGAWAVLGLIYGIFGDRIDQGLFMGLYWLVFGLSLYAMFLVVTALNMRAEDNAAPELPARPSRKERRAARHAAKRGR